MTIKTTEDAIDFLKRHQPMPSSEEAGDELWRNYQDSVLLIPDDSSRPEAIPLLLNSYNGLFIPDCFGGLNWDYPIDKTLPHFLNALNSPNKFTRNIALFFIDSMYCDNALFSNKHLVSSIVTKLEDPYNESRISAFFILVELEANSIYSSKEDRDFIRRCYLNENDTFLKRMYEECPDTFEAIVDLIPNREQAHRDLRKKAIPWGDTVALEEGVKECMEEYPEFKEIWLKLGTTRW